ncbi:hypothetical protein [Streptomyces sp. NPDC048057]|uniref:hypothetical protein n=1 Tax=Streptomyces sp. NPDC048057 TaxID=3155628 RepID=UPI0033FF3AA6
MDERGTVDLGVLRAYAVQLDAAPVGGFVVWAHTGRGLYLSAADRARVLRTWRAATDKPLVAVAGVPRDLSPATVAEAEAAVEAMAVTAAELGADAVMVYPLHALTALPDGHDRAVRLHERVAAASGLPVLGFFLHGEAGGYAYRRHWSATCWPCRGRWVSNWPPWTARWPARTRSVRPGPRTDWSSPARTVCSAPA